MSKETAAIQPDAARAAAALSAAYIVAMAAEVLHAFPLDFLDLLLVFTIASANAVLPQGGGTEKSGISRNAVSRALNIPLETVRRRIGNLVAKKVLLEQADGLVFDPANPLGLGNNPQLAATNLEQLRQLFRGLKGNRH